MVKSVMHVAESSKCIFQITKLLEERKLGFAFCLNKNQTLLLCGFATIYSIIEIPVKGTLLKKNQKLASDILSTLQKCRYPLLKEYRNITAAVRKIDCLSTTDISLMTKCLPSPSSKRKVASSHASTRQSSEFTSSTAELVITRERSDVKSDLKRGMSLSRRPSSLYQRNNSQTSSKSQQEFSNIAENPTLSNNHVQTSLTPIQNAMENLDIFSWSTGTQNGFAESLDHQAEEPDEQWERTLAVMDQNTGVSIYGGMPHTEYDVDSLSVSSSQSEERKLSESASSAASMWNMQQVLHPTAANVSTYSALQNHDGKPFFSDELSADNFFGDAFDPGAVSNVLGVEWLL